VAKALHAQFGKSVSIPAEVELPAAVLERATRGPTRAIDDPIHRDVLRALAVLKRPCDREELTAATGLPRGTVERALRALEEDEAVTRHVRGRRRLHGLSHPEDGQVLYGRVSRRSALRVHERMVRFFEERAKKDEGSLESLARHLLASGKRREGREAAMEAVKGLRGRGLLHAAVRLLAEAISAERDGGWRLRFAEELSALHQETGDHHEGIHVLAPLLHDKLEGPSAMRIRRRLGVHFHRAGSTKEALKLFEEVRVLADPTRDVAELILIETELAEMHTLRGEYPRAERACSTGLGLLAKAEGTSREFRDSMEVMLRASLGHLELRRMALGRAKEELEAACRLAGTSGSTAMRALILHNLGIVHSHLNDFTRARGFYRRAEDLLEHRGDRHGVIHAACNLATIAAKLGDAAGARVELERASRLMAHYPGMRLEFVVELARGMVAHFLGDAPAAIESFERAIPLGRKLGDVQFTSFAEVYLAESRLTTGAYGGAMDALRGLSDEATENGPPILERMVQARLLLLSSLLGSDRAAVECRRRLEKTPRTGVSLLEAWNDLFLATERAATGDLAGAGRIYEGCLQDFLRMGIPAGTRLARVGLILSDLGRGNAPRLSALLEESRAQGPTSHKVLSVLEPLCRGEAHLALGDLDEAERAIEEAAGAIVGISFLELDWRIEFLRARVAERRGDREGARRSVHRSLHTRDLLARSLPGRLRARFLDHGRFSAIAKLADRLKRPRLTPVLEAPREARGRFQGMIGVSRAMKDVFATIDRLRDQEIPVLITGESGTGKELVARAFHETGPRRGGPFLVLHAASLPPELFEAELFGHEEGAFTGATEARKGILETLAGGTLLLDEVASLSPPLQAKVLRVLESKVIRPLGGVQARGIDVRFLASSSMDLERLVATGAFRQDLYYRLSGVLIHLPPLRARKEDIPALAEHLLATHARRMERPTPVLTADGLAFLAECEWPGNVRQLEGALVRLIVTASPGAQASGRTLRALLARPDRPSIFSDDLLAGRDLKTLRRELDRAYLTRLFRETGGDLRKMAAALGVKVSGLYLWLRRAGIDIRALRREL
jgi:DNA-binding NtrC family response regulator/DNA-binding transcriptional ArsR family regulator